MDATLPTQVVVQPPPRHSSVLKTSKQPPPFVGVGAASALEHCGMTQKERLLRSSTSLPELTQKPRSGIQWLAGTPHALVPPRLGTSEARLWRASKSPPDLQLGTPRTTKTYHSLPATADMDSSFPSLMCLLGEDAVHI